MDWKEINDLLNSQIKENTDVFYGYEQIKKFLSQNNLPIAQIDIKGILRDFQDWLIEILEKEPIPNNIKSIYFGIATMSFPEVDNGKEKTTVYIAGSKMTPTEDADWVCDTAYFPNRRYLLLDDFEKIDKLKSEKKLSGDYEVLVFNGLLNLLVLNSVNNLKYEFLTYQDKKLGIFKIEKRRVSLHFGAGFDSGDVYLFKELKNE